MASIPSVPRRISSCNLVSSRATAAGRSAPHRSDSSASNAAVRPGAILGCAIWGLAAFNGYMPLYALKIGMKGASPVFLANAVVIMLFRSIGARIPDKFGPLRTARFALLFTPIGLAIMGAWVSVPGLFTGARSGPVKPSRARGQPETATEQAG